MAKTAGSTRPQIEEAIRKRTFAPIYLLMGEEAFFIDRITEMIVKHALTEDERDFNLITFYGSDASMSDVILACRRYPMMAERQVVLLKEAQTAKTGKQLNWKLLQQYALDPTPSTVLVVCYKGEAIKAPGLAKAIQTPAGKLPAGVVFESPRLREYNIDKAVADYAASVGCRIEEQAQAMLIDHIGLDMAMIAKEIDKLKMSLPAGAAITAASVEQNVGISKEYNNFELVTAFARRDSVKIFKILRYFRSNPKKGPSVVAASMLFTFFANLLIAFYSRATDERTLMEALRMKSPYFLKDYRIGMKAYNATQSLKAIVALREFDTRSKGIGSNRNEYDLLEELATKILNA